MISVHWTLTLSTLAAGALLLAACGGGAAPAAPTTAPASAPKTETKTTTQAAPTAAPKTETKAQAPTTAPAASPQAQAGLTKASGDPVKFGILCDRSGPTVNVQTYLCDGIHGWFDYINNAEGGIKGRPMEATEVDFKYEVPVGVDSYKKLLTRDRIQHMVPLGTPLVDALSATSGQDQVVLWSPGFGVSEAADGTKFPYIFVGVATYNAQAQAAMQYIADEWKQLAKTGNPKVVYMYYDNPAGRDPLELIQRQGPTLGLDVIDTVAVPATTVDMTTIMTQIKDKNPDYVISHLFGRPPALSLQAAEKVGLPREKMISLVWGIAEDEIKVAQQAAEGYRGLQFAAHPNDNPEAYQKMEAYWQATGQPAIPKARESLHFARGMVIGNFAMQAARNADDPNSGPSLKKGAESFQNFTANGLLAGTSLTPEDHGGTRMVRMYQVKDQKLQMIRDWFEGPKE